MSISKENSNIEELISCLNKLYGYDLLDEKFVFDECFQNNYLSDDDERFIVMGKTDALAFQVYTELGYPKMKQILDQNGYYVGPGETDSFGWLTGVIQKKSNGDKPYPLFIFG